MRTSPTAHCVCFACRKQFRKPSRWDGIDREFHPIPRDERLYDCPDCGRAMVNIGKYFKAPRRADKKAWEQLRLLAAHGIRFFSTGSSYALAPRRPAGGSTPSLRETKAAIAACPCHTRSEGQRLLRKLKEADTPHGHR